MGNKKQHVLSGPGFAADPEACQPGWDAVLPRMGMMRPGGPTWLGHVNQLHLRVRLSSWKWVLLSYRN